MVCSPSTAADASSSASSKSDADDSNRERFARLYNVPFDAQVQCPIVYAEEYNIGFFGMERLHPFDSKKWGRVYRLLIGRFALLFCKL
jgi:histone deacetylase 11